MIALESESELPNNNWEIFTEMGDEYLKVSFRAVKIYDKHVQTVYSLWFSRTAAEVECWMFKGDLP